MKKGNCLGQFPLRLQAAQAQQATLHRAYQEQGYVVFPQLIPALPLAAWQDYCARLETQGYLELGDPLVPDRLRGEELALGHVDGGAVAREHLARQGEVGLCAAGLDVIHDGGQPMARRLISRARASPTPTP